MNKGLRNRIVEYIEANQPSVYWDPRDVNKDTLKRLLTKGKEDFEEDLFENNIGEYLFELENDFIEDIVGEFEEELAEINTEDVDEGSFREFCMEFICVDRNLKEMYGYFPDLNVLLIGHSNFDCCNSCDDPYNTAPDDYIGAIYRQIKYGVLRRDLVKEFYNGAYGGALFMFGFSCDVNTYFELQEEMKTGKDLVIPKGTNFGFHSSMHGASSCFEHSTHRKLRLPIHGDTKYDVWELQADITMDGYSLMDVFGCNLDFGDDVPEVTGKGDLG